MSLSSSISIPMNVRPVLMQDIPTVPVPIMQSRTVSNDFDSHGCRSLRAEGLCSILRRVVLRAHPLPFRGELFGSHSDCLAPWPLRCFGHSFGQPPGMSWQRLLPQTLTLPFRL